MQQVNAAVAAGTWPVPPGPALFSWGVNSSGQLGLTNTTSYSSPKQVGALLNWAYINSGGTLSSAIKTDGTLWCWGDGATGKLGDNTTTSKSSPVQTITFATNWNQVASNGQHAAGIKTDGTLWTWGDNLHGQLGDNTTINRSSPIQTVAGGTTWSQVACGEQHTAAIKTNGTLWSWGDNSYGQLGDGTITQRSSPIQEIGAGTTWTFVSVPVFNNSTLALKSDNKMYGAGDYFPSSYSSFTQFYTGDKTWMRVSKGGYHILAISYGKSPSPSGPTMFWPDPVPKASGYALSAETLNASVLADAGGQLPGSIIYDPAKGTVLSVGTQTLYATSLPTENYNTQTISRTITIT
jgi:alpha-tubulin suppressor-like RCC1 family protein